MIKAILFDVDGVILDSFESNLDFYQRLMTSHGYPSVTRKEYLSLFHLPLREVIRHIAPDISESELDSLCDARLIRQFLPDESKARLEPGAERAIVQLSDQKLLGLVTSRIKIGVYEHSLIKPLLKYMKVVVTIEDTREHKPLPEPLLLAASRLGVKPHECVYVGDAETDLQAARAAGMKIIMYAKKTNEEADATFHGFDQLSKLIMQLEVIRC